MEIILKEDVAKLGKAGDIVKVKDGYARNYLIPKGLGLKVTQASLKMIEVQRNRQRRKEEEARRKVRELADRLANLSCTVAVSAGENDRLFGTVTNADVAEALKQEGVELDKRDIVLEEEVHRLGIYYFKVRLHPEIIPRVKLWVVKK